MCKIRAISFCNIHELLLPYLLRSNLTTTVILSPSLFCAEVFALSTCPSSSSSSITLVNEQTDTSRREPKFAQARTNSRSAVQGLSTPMKQFAKFFHPPRAGGSRQRTRGRPPFDPAPDAPPGVPTDRHATERPARQSRETRPGRTPGGPPAGVEAGRLRGVALATEPSRLSPMRF